mmetsp:Transcript_11518/g.40588  ORF Transcript_11518/g.40588 Transcript_11518/m.40588 type:complete len:309 (-) Transcript_11518:3943-4869(-)
MCHCPRRPRTTPATAGAGSPGASPGAGGAPRRARRGATACRCCGGPAMTRTLYWRLGTWDFTCRCTRRARACSWSSVQRARATASSTRRRAARSTTGPPKLRARRPQRWRGPSRKSFATLILATASSASAPTRWSTTIKGRPSTLPRSSTARSRSNPSTRRSESTPTTLEASRTGPSRGSCASRWAAWRCTTILSSAVKTGSTPSSDCSTASIGVTSRRKGQSTCASASRRLWRAPLPCARRRTEWAGNPLRKQTRKMIRKIPRARNPQLQRRPRRLPSPQETSGSASPPPTTARVLTARNWRWQRGT